MAPIPLQGSSGPEAAVYYRSHFLNRPTRLAKISFSQAFDDGPLATIVLTGRCWASKASKHVLGDPFDVAALPARAF